MIFRLFNFFIHLPPSLVPPNKFTSPSCVCLRSPQAIKRGLWPQRNFPFCCSLSACPPTVTVCCLSPAAARRQSGSCSKGRNAQAALRRRTGRREKAGRGDFSFGWGHGWIASLRASRASRRALTPLYTLNSIQLSCLSTEPLQTLCYNSIALLRTVMWGHRGPL